ncbi:flagellar hook-length control protein FliK [Pantoea sp. BAV 3049]|uniref:flagellar hook-length control protein FliK n=1 Tax=Pantoea sp. BAV 3049 TaxID=2654188 RepID=UPI00131EB4B8|nr:flagellar hook-length control protein FliK [Pantoea sp. BAV 3049]
MMPVTSLIPTVPAAGDSLPGMNELPGQTEVMPALMPLLTVPQPVAGDDETLMPIADETTSDEPQGDPQMLLDLLLTDPGVQLQPVTEPGLTVIPQPEQSGQPQPAAIVPQEVKPVPVTPLSNSNPVMDETPAADEALPPEIAAPPVTTRSAAAERPAQPATAEALPVSKVTQQDKQPGQTGAVMPQSLQHASISPLLSAALQRENSVSGSVLHLPAAHEAQAEVLQKALSEKLEMQISQQSQKATIRLDPPQLGKLDITLHYEAGKLQVQIQAAQPEIYRALQQVSEQLRISLSEQNNVQVNVQVSSQSGDSRQQQRHPSQPDTPVAQNFEEGASQGPRTDGTILTMV